MSTKLNLSQGILSKIWDSSTNTFKTDANAPSVVAGNLYVGYNSSDKRAMLFADIDGHRYSFTGNIKWSDISGTENIATKEDISNLDTSIGEGYLKKADGGTVEKDLLVGASITLDADDGLITAKKIKLTDLTNVTTPNKLVVLDSSNLMRTVTVANFKKKLSLENVNNTSDANKPVSTAQANAIAEAASNAATALSGQDVANKKLYFSSLTNDTSKTNTFILSSSTSKADGGNEQTWTATNIYPTAVTWNTDNTSSLTGSITMKNNGVTATAVSIPAIPVATQTTYGIVNNTNQTFGGLKNFASAIQLNGKLTLAFNDDTESLDFTFA